MTFALTSTDRSLDRRLYVVRQAIVEHRSLSASYDRRAIRFTPRIVGRECNGRMVVAGYQYADEWVHNLRPGGDWCRLELGRLDRLALNLDSWIPGPVGLPDAFHDIELI